MLTIYNFTPFTALIGGMLIGLASSILILGIGKIAGISGIGASAFFPNNTKQKLSWQFVFMMGLFVSTWVYELTAGFFSVAISDNYFLIVMAGLLVGFGTRLGAGCTSGHGVCGLSRLSPRSLVAVLSFMSVGFATVYVAKHLLTIA